jgi:hypothetical protein
LFYSILCNELTDVYTKIQKTMDSTDKSEFGVHLLKSDARTPCFHIESLLRLLTSAKKIKSQHKKNLAILLKEIKELEDLLGDVDELLVTRENAQKMMSPIRASELEIKIEAISLKVFMTSTKLLGSTNHLQKKLKFISFLKKTSQTEAIKIANKSIAKELKKTLKKAAESILPNLRTKSFSYELMEDNFHEFRRNLRWLPIYMHTLKSLYGLSPYSLVNTTSQERTILKKYKGNVFAEINSSNSPVIIDRYSFYLFSHYIAISGALKNKIELSFDLKKLNISIPLKTGPLKKEMANIVEDFLESGVIWFVYDNLQSQKG